MKYKRFRTIEDVKRRVEKKVVRGAFLYDKEGISHKMGITFYRTKEKKYLIFMDDYDARYALMDGTIFNEVKKEFNSIEKLLDYLEKETLIRLENLYYS